MDVSLTDREVAAAWLVLYSHPDLIDLDVVDARWYADPERDYRRPLTRDDREAARVWLFLHTAGPALDGLAASMNAMAAQFAGALAQVAEAFASMRKSLVEAGVVSDEPPSDPKARALHLRRHRNTGPQVHADPLLSTSGHDETAPTNPHARGRPGPVCRAGVSSEATGEGRRQA